MSGPLEIPDDALWGAHTQQTLDNFPLSETTVHPALIHLEHSSPSIPRTTVSILFARQPRLFTYSIAARDLQPGSARRKAHDTDRDIPALRLPQIGGHLFQINRLKGIEGDVPYPGHLSPHQIITLRSLGDGDLLLPGADFIGSGRA